MSVWIVTTVIVSVMTMTGHQNETLMNVCGYSFGTMLFFAFEKMIVTENKTKKSIKDFFNKDKRRENRRVKRKKRSEGCGCKK